MKNKSKRANRLKVWEYFSKIFQLFLVLFMIGWTLGIPAWLPFVFKADAYTWTINDILTTAEGYYTSLAFDSTGKPAMAYSRLSGGSYDLYYAYFTGASWVTESIDTGNNKFTSLAFDSSDIPYIAYYDAGNGNLDFARRGASGTTTLDPDEGTGEADCADTDWNCSAIDSTNVVGADISLAFDSGGTMAIAYRYVTGADLRYASYVGNGGTGCAIDSWVCEDVFTTETSGKSVSLAFNGTTAYIGFMYQETGVNNFVMASRDGAGAGNCDDAGANNNNWNCETVVGDIDTAVELRTISIAFSNGTAGGTLGAAYITGTTSDLYYAQRTAGAGCTDGDWTCTAVDTTSAVSEFVDLVWATSTIPAISYYDGTAANLLYAEYNGSWATETVDSANATGEWNSIARSATKTAMAYFDSTDGDLVVAQATISYNTAPVATTPTSISQATDGTGYVSFATTISDTDSNDTRLKVEYSDDGGSTWYDPDLVSATPSAGSVDLDDANAYQIGTANAIDTSGGAKTVTIVWDTMSASNGNGSLDGTAQSDIQVRVTPNDATVDGTAQASASFSLDNLDPSDMGGFSVAVVATNTDTPSWTAATETNFNHYEIWYGTVQADVQSRSGTASEWDNADDASMTTRTTTSTIITGLSINTRYYFKIWAIDNYGNVQTLSDANLYTLADTPGSPTVAVDTTTTMNISISADSNPSTTEYAIYENGNANYVQSDGSLGVGAAWQTSSAWGTKTVTGLVGNTQYVFKTKARNGDTTETAFGSTNSKYTYATQVSSFTAAEATDKTNYKINLTWSNPTPAPTGMSIFQDTSCDDVWDTTVYNNASAMPTSPYSISGLTANTCYKFRAAAYNGDGSPNLTARPETGAETLGPAQPIGLTHSANTTDSISWDWSDVSGATDYKVYRSSDDVLVGTVGSATSAYTLSTLSANTQYTVYVRATNASGEGIGSSTASAYTSANIPINLGHTNQTTAAMRWTWETGGAQAAYYSSTDSPAGNSGWITDAYWDQASLSENTSVTMSVKARNTDTDETSAASISRYTSISAPTGITYSDITAASITVTATGTFPNLTSGSSAINFSNVETTVEQQSAVWINSGLLPNTSYTYSVFAKNGDGDSTTGGGSSKYTLANVPSAPTVQGPAATTLTVVINQNSNPSNTTYAIQEVSSGNYVAASGALGAGEVWQTYTVWGGVSGIVVTGLSVNTGYQFKVKARNGDSTDTDLSSANTAVYTLANAPGTPTVQSPTASTLTVIIDINSNSADTTFAIQESNSGNYVAASGALGAGEVWQTYTVWGGASGIAVTGLSANTSYSFKAKARNGDTTETALSSAASLYSAQNTPTAVTASLIAFDALTVTASGTFTNLTTGSSGLYFENSTNSTNSGWVTTNSWLNSSLSGNTTYSYRAKARNANGTETAFSSASLLTTTSSGSLPEPTPPAPPPPPPKQCADGKDNDNDGRVDLVDVGCANASDDNEADHPQAPTVSDPANGSATNNNKPYIIGATWQGTQTVDIYIDNVKANSLTSQADKNYVWKVATALADGLHEVYAIMGTLKSNVNSVLVDTQPPNAPLIELVTVKTQEQSQDKILAGVSIHGQVYDDTKYVLLYLDNNILLSTIAVTGNTWSYDLSEVLSAGTHTVFAKATDSVNNVSPVAQEKSFILALSGDEKPPTEDKPSEPEKPKEPVKPVVPDRPVIPEIPSEPNAPVVPVEPQQPVVPRLPTVPAEDSAPGDGGERPLPGGEPGEGGEMPLPTGGAFDDLGAGDTDAVQDVFDSNNMPSDLLDNPVMQDLIDKIDQKNEWNKSADERQIEMIYETRRILDSDFIKKAEALVVNLIGQMTGQDVTAQVGKTVASVVKTMKKAEKATVDNPAVEKVNAYAKQPAFAATMVTATASVATVGTTGATGATALTYLQFLFTQPLLLFARRKREKWGVVYNSITKRPVDLAVVRVFDIESGRLLRSRVTDREGRYFFLLNPGKYRVEVEKKEFKFPSSIIGETKQDGKFENVYTGGEFEVTEKDALNRPIPLDPQRAFLPAKQVLRLHLARNWQMAFTGAGPGLALFSLVINPKWWVAALLVVQIAMYFIFKKLAVGEKPKSFGLVKHVETKRAIGRAVVRVFDTKFNKLLESQVTDTGGRYGFLVGNQEYYMTAEKPGFFEERTGRYDLSSEPNGYLTDDFHLRPHGLGDDIVSAQRQGKQVTWRSDVGRQVEQSVDGVQKVVRKDEEKFNLPVVGVDQGETHEDYYSLDYLASPRPTEMEEIKRMEAKVSHDVGEIKEAEEKMATEISELKQVEAKVEQQVEAVKAAGLDASGVAAAGIKEVELKLEKEISEIKQVEQKLAEEINNVKELEKGLQDKIKKTKD